MEDYYKILKITNGADAKEIKKAYAKLIRQYPPENFPEEFKKIRKAYEALNNMDSCEFYNSSGQEEDYFDEHEDNCNNEYDNELDNKENNIQITPKTDFKDVMRVYLLHFNNKNYEEAERTLNLAIDKTSLNNSNNIMFYFELLELYICKRDVYTFINKLNELFDNITLEDKKDTRIEYLYDNLKKLRERLLRLRKILYWLIVSTKITYMETGVKENIYEVINQYRMLYERYSKDYKNSTSFRMLLEIWFENSMSDSERMYKLNKLEKGIYRADKTIMLKSIKRLSKKYNKIYEIDSQYFNTIYKNIKNSMPKISDIVNIKVTLIAILAAVLAPQFFIFICFPAYLVYNLIKKIRNRIRD